MKILSFGEEAGRQIDHYGSRNLLFSRIAHLTGPTHVSCMILGENWLVGYHQATMPQLFLVVSGRGWVRGEPTDRHPIHPGQAAYWEKGELHEAGTDTGLTAIVIEIEAQHFDPADFMAQL